MWGFLFFSASMLLHRDTIIKHDIGLSAEQADSKQLYLADDLFRQISVNRLGFARRFEPFIPAMVTIGEIAMGKIDEKCVWFLWENSELVGYIIVKISRSVLNIMDLLLVKGVNAVNAIASLARKLPAPYIQVKSNHPSITQSLSKIGARVVPRDWSTFMMKPLTSEAMNIDQKNLFGIGTDRFLFSWLDST